MELIVVGAAIRFGVQGCMIDNVSQGGVAVGIDVESGRLIREGYDFANKIHLSHPDNNIVFEGFQIPQWDSVVALAEKLQRSFPYFRLLGHDIAVTVDGPVCIEMNAAYDNVGLEMNYGPILRNDRLREEFNREGLLINGPSQQL
jgi:hypothetical protein